MANCSEGFSQQTAEVNAMNAKLGLDEQFDNRRELLARSRAWETLQLRISNDAATVSHMINVGAVLAGQVGTTSGQQTVSPVRTAVGENVTAGATPANRIVDTGGAVASGGISASVAEAALGNVTAQLANLVTEIAGLAALMAQVVQNAKQAPAA